MAEKGFPAKFDSDQAEPGPVSGGGLREKLAGASSRAFAVTKLILGICLLPFVYSLTLAFIEEAKTLPLEALGDFVAGIVTFLVVYLFVWEPVRVYLRGQKILQTVFSFFSPLVRVAPYLLPIYTLLCFAFYGLVALFDRSGRTLGIFVFLFGFTIALHLVFSAKSLRGRKGDFLKSNYIFGFSFVYLVNLLMLGFGMSLVFAKFSFVRLCNQSYQIAAGLLYGAVKQLFL